MGIMDKKRETIRVIEYIYIYVYPDVRGLSQDGDEEAIQIENTFYEADPWFIPLFPFRVLGRSWGLSLPYYRVILGIFGGYIVRMEKNMEATIVFRV